MRQMSTLIVGLLLAGCATGSPSGYKAPVGALTGAGLGALVGSHIGHGDGRLAAIAGLGVLGAILGYEAGQSLERADAVYARTTPPTRSYTPVPGVIYPAVPPGPAAPPSQYVGATMPGCRVFEQRAWVDNHYVPVYGTACQQWDGTWRVIP